MGVNFLWRDFPANPKSLVELCAAFHDRHGQPPRVAIDVSQMLFHVCEEKSSANAHIEHRILIRRFAAFVAAGFAVTCVFDSPSVFVKRGVAVRRQETGFGAQAREIITAFGFAIVDAPGEAEAQCATLQLNGTVDFVFSNDADVLANGARAVLKYSPESESANTAIERLVDEIHVVRPVQEYVLRSVLQGCDWNDGVRSIGCEYARNIAESPQLSADLVKIAEGSYGHLNLVRGVEWWDKLVGMLEKGEFGRRNLQLSNLGHREKEGIVLTLLKTAKRLVNPLVSRHVEDTGSAVPNWSVLMQLWQKESAALQKAPGKSEKVESREKSLRDGSKKRDSKVEFANAIAPAYVSWQLLHLKQHKRTDRVFMGPPRIAEIPWLGNIQITDDRALAAVHFDRWPLETMSIPRPGSSKVFIPSYIARKKASVLIIKKSGRSSKGVGAAGSVPSNNMSLLDVFAPQRRVEPPRFKVEKEPRRGPRGRGSKHLRSSNQHLGIDEIL